MSELKTLVVLCITLSLIILIVLQIYYSRRPAKNTICPNCGKRKESVTYGKYKCTDCGARFYVDFQGYSDIPTLSTIIGGFILSLGYLAFCAFHIVNTEISEPGVLRSYLGSGLSLFGIIHSMRMYIKHRNRYA